MTEIPDNPQSLQPEQTPPATPRPIRREFLIVLGIVASGPAVAFLSKDWCCTTVGWTVLSAFLVAVFDLLLAPLVRRGRCTRKMQFLPMAVLLIVLIAFFARSPTRVFRRVFGVPPPPGISNLALDSANWGPGGGEETILIRFTADQAAIDRLVQHRGFAVDEDMKLFDEMGRDWTWLWRHAFTNFPQLGGRAWKEVPLMADPVLFVHNRSEGIAPVTVKMLWDRASGRTYVLCLN